MIAGSASLFNVISRQPSKSMSLTTRSIVHGSPYPWRLQQAATAQFAIFTDNSSPDLGDVRLVLLVVGFPSISVSTKRHNSVRHQSRDRCTKYRMLNSLTPQYQDKSASDCGLIAKPATKQNRQPNASRAMCAAVRIIGRKIVCEGPARRRREFLTSAYEGKHPFILLISPTVDQYERST